MAVLAFLPVLVPMVMIALRRPSIHAASVGVACALVVSALWFPVRLGEIPGMALSWAPLLLEVLLIVAGGLLLSEANRITGRQALLSEWLERSVGAGVGAALIVVHGVTPFAESLTGFGIGITVAVPLLVRLGFGSRQAVALGLLGLCAVPWGSMGPGTLIAAELSGIGFRDLGIASALANGPVFLAVGVAAALIASGKHERRGALLSALGSGLVLWLAVTASNFVFGTATAGAIGSLLTVLVHLAFHKWKGQKVSMDSVHSRGLTGYVVLLGGVILASLLLAILGKTDGAARFAASPALWLFVAAGFIVSRRHAREVTVNGLKKWVHVGPVTGLFVVLGVVMAESGMATAIADAVSSIGPAYALALPFVAGAGGYLTGSNSAANAMFAAPHAQIASSLGTSLVPTMAVHNVSSSMFMMASPGKVELAAQLSGQPNEGRRVLAQVGTVVLSTALLLGIGLAAFSVLVS